MPQPQAVREIRVKAVAEGEGFRIIAAEMQRLNKSVASTKSVMDGLTTSLPLVAAGFGAFSLARMSDEMQLTSDRMKVFAKDGEDTAESFNKLVAASNLTRTSVADLGTVYNRLIISSKELGISSNAVLATTVALQDTFRLSGASAAEATGAAIQLSQGLSSGQLRGQELRSVLEANGVMAQILAKHFNIATGQLIKFAEQGKITSKEVLTALANNMESLRSNAAGMGVTFEQSFNILKNAVAVNMKDINEQFGISGVFNKGIVFLTNNLWLLNSALTVVAAVAIPRVIASVVELSTILLANPISAIALGVGVAIAALINFDETVKLITNTITLLHIGWLKLSLAMNEIPLVGWLIQRAFIGIEVTAVALYKTLTLVWDALSLILKGVSLLTSNPIKLVLSGDMTIKEFLSSGEDMKNTYTDLTNSFKSTNKETEALTKKISELQAEYDKNSQGSNKFSIDLKKSFEDAKKEILKMKDVQKDLLGGTKAKKETKEIAQVTEQFRELNREYEIGEMTVRTYNERLQEMELESVNAKFDRGAISVMEYHNQLTKLQNTMTDSTWISGINNYLQSAGTLSSNISSLVTSTFSRLEDHLTSFVMKGKFQFREFTNAVLEDLMRIIIRASIIKPLAEGLLGSFTASASGGVGDGTQVSSSISTSASTQSVPINMKARGGAYSNGIEFFANGGLVNSPTLFTFANGGKVGMMGEAGTEAIMPLKRTSTGDLGVNASGLGGSNVVVNVVNNSNDSEVQTSESTASDGSKVIDVIIVQKTKEALAKGSFDKEFSALYGMKRKGT